MDNKKHFVILGGNMLLRGVYDKLKEYGYIVIVVDWNEEPALKGDLHIQLDVKNSECVLHALQSLEVFVDGCISCIDLAVPTVNVVNKWCGNKVMPENFMKVLTKSEMRDCWLRDNIFGRISRLDSDFSIEDIYLLNKQSKLIIKPNVAASSRGITIIEKNQSRDFIVSALDKAKELSFDAHCLVEEFVEGREFTVDMLGDDTGNVSVYAISVKYHSKNALNNRVATKLHWNSNVYSNEIYEKIADIGKRCYKSIGLKNSFGHLEIIMREDGSFSPVEIGARSSGYICSHLVSAAAERDYLMDYIKMLKGEYIEPIDHINSKTSSMWYGYDIPKDSYSVCESNLAKYLPSKIDVIYSKRNGLMSDRHYGGMVDDNSRDDYGFEMMVGPKSVLTIDNILEAEKSFLDEFLGEF